MGLITEYRRNQEVKTLAKMVMALAPLSGHLIRIGFQARKIAYL
jgi:hypothetical protein